VIWVGKNLAEQGIICCIYNARDVGMVSIAITLAYAVAIEAVIRCMFPAAEKPHQALDA